LEVKKERWFTGLTLKYRYAVRGEYSVKIKKLIF
jgi:hypothetical protein